MVHCTSETETRLAMDSVMTRIFSFLRRWWMAFSSSSACQTHTKGTCQFLSVCKTDLSGQSIMIKIFLPVTCDIHTDLWKGEESSTFKLWCEVLGRMWQLTLEYVQVLQPLHHFFGNLSCPSRRNVIYSSLCMSSSQTSLWSNRGRNFLTIQLLISPLEQGGKEQVPPATERPDLDQSHLLVAFHPLLSHQATNKLMSYFSRAELKGGKCKGELSLNTLIPSAACVQKQVLPPLLFSRRNAMGLHSRANREQENQGMPSCHLHQG